MSTKLSLSLAVLVALGALSGCRQVTIVEFKVDPNIEAPEVDQVVVDASPQKQAIYLGGLHETVGFYDLNAGITIRTWGCNNEKVVLFGQETYQVAADRITVVLSRLERDEACPRPDGFGGLYQPPGLGGMSGIGGMGGQTTLPGTGGAAGNPDAGSPDGGAGSTGIGGVTGTGGITGFGGSDGGVDGGGGECGDIHDGGADLGVCEPFSGSPSTNEVPRFTVTPACESYCAAMFAPANGGVVCPGVYHDIAECQRYCAVVNWPDGNPPPMTDSGDTIACRNRYLEMAKTFTDPRARAPKCDIAGPSAGTTSGGTAGECAGAAGLCVKYCNAWSAICEKDRNTCVAACSTLTPPLTTCRFTWLVAASADRRYCAWLDLAAPFCLVPGC